MRRIPFDSTNRLRVFLFGLLAASLLAAGCSDDDDPMGPGEGFDVSPLLENVAHEVIAKTYADLGEAASDLADATDALAAAPDEGLLAQARDRWREARRPWEQSEGFLFGPVSTLGIDPAVDSWPVNTVDLDAVLSSGDPLTPEVLDGLEGTLKGFHTIEYLLFGTDGEKLATAFTARELEYLVATAGNLENEAARLAEAWSASGGNFGNELVTAGQSGSIYVSRRAAVQELVAGLSGIADEVGNGKINDPFATEDPTLEESRFSANSIQDFQDNIRSVRNVYLGAYGNHDGAGVSDFVRHHDTALDDRILAEIDGAIAAIGAIPAPFSRAIFEDKPSVETAQSAVRALQETIDSELSPLLDRIP